jgi:hypothetical protein
MGSVHHERIQVVLGPQAYVEFLDLVLVAEVCHFVEFETFEEWNPDPEIAVRAFSFLMSWLRLTVLFKGAARRLYNHIDNLELYVCLSLYIGKPVLIFLHTAGSSGRIYNAIDNRFTFRLWLHGLSFIAPTTYSLLIIFVDNTSCPW